MKSRRHNKRGTCSEHVLTSTLHLQGLFIYSTHLGQTLLSYCIGSCQSATIMLLVHNWLIQSDVMRMLILSSDWMLEWYATLYLMMSRFVLRLGNSWRNVALLGILWRNVAFYENYGCSSYWSEGKTRPPLKFADGPIQCLRTGPKRERQSFIYNT